MAKLDRSYLACGQHRSCEDVVWRQAAQAEACCRGSSTSDCVAGAILFDVRQFFDSFDISLLVKRAAMLGIPARLIKLSANMYRGRRYVRMGTSVVDAGYAKCGLPAGCCLCFLWVVVYSIPPLDAFVTVWATLEVNVYMDDIVIGKQGSMGGGQSPSG